MEPWQPVDEVGLFIPLYCLFCNKESTTTCRTNLQIALIKVWLFHPGPNLPIQPIHNLDIHHSPSFAHHLIMTFMTYIMLVTVKSRLFTLAPIRQSRLFTTQIFTISTHRRNFPPDSQKNFRNHFAYKVSSYQTQKASLCSTPV